MTFEVYDANGSLMHLAASGSGTGGDPFVPIHGTNSTGPVKTRLDRYLDTIGDGTGNKSAIDNYSDGGLGETAFFIQPPPGQVYRLSRMIIFIEDEPTFDSGGYGSGNFQNPLPIGIKVQVRDDGGIISDLTDGRPIKTNAQWAKVCFDAAYSEYGGGQDSLAIRWTFTRAGDYIRLVGSNNERLQVLMNDNVSYLTEHTFLVQGYIE